jgi:uncharacterized protein DUF642
MPVPFQEPPGAAEVRYDAETVQKAAVLAARLQREKERTLSLQEVDALAAELNIDAGCMRQALSVVRREQGEKPRAAGLIAGLLGMSLAAGSLAIGLLLLSYLTTSVSTTSVPTPVAAAEVVPLNWAEPQVRPTRSLLKNGSFNTGPGLTGSRVLKTGSHALRGWTVVSGSVGYIRRPGSTSATDRCVILGVEERLRQTFRTVPGRTYRIILHMLGKPGPAARTHTLVVSAGNVSWSQSCFTDAAGEGRPTWEHHEMDFVAEDIGTTLNLTANLNRNGEASELILDNVSVVPVQP